MEDFSKRLNRFKYNPPNEIIDTLIASIDNNFIRTELEIACGEKCFNLLFIGIHAVAETISEGIYGKDGLNGFKFYLENFVDGQNQNNQFSKIAKDINDWRNILIHQWLSKKGCYFGYNPTMIEGWKKDKGILYLNPISYFEHFKKGFKSGGMIWNYRQLLNVNKQQKTKERLFKKFLRG